VQGIFFTGMFIGGSAGLALGGILAQRWGWRAAFFVVGVPGLILALATLRLPEPPPVRDTSKPVRLRTLLRDPAYVVTVAGGWFMAFAAYSYIFWGTEFISRYKGFGLAEAGIVLGGSLAVAGVLGILVGAWISDQLMRHVPWGHVSVVGMGVLLGMPFLFGAVHTSGRIVFVALFFLACFFMSWYHGPLTATFHHLVPDSTHASAVGFYYFFVNLFAVTVAPPVLGRLADRHDLMTAIHVPMAAQFLAAVCFFAVAYLIHRREARRAVSAVASLAES
jgi:predicted MFS family arabinose efflux permease